VHLSGRRILKQVKTLDDKSLVGVKNTFAVAYTLRVLLKLVAVHRKVLRDGPEVYTQVTGDPSHRFALVVMELVNGVMHNVTV